MVELQRLQDVASQVTEILHACCLCLWDVWFIHVENHWLLLVGLGDVAERHIHNLIILIDINNNYWLFEWLKNTRNYHAGFKHFCFTLIMTLHCSSLINTQYNNEKHSNPAARFGGPISYRYIYWTCFILILIKSLSRYNHLLLYCPGLVWRLAKES